MLKQFIRKTHNVHILPMVAMIIMSVLLAGCNNNNTSPKTTLAIPLPTDAVSPVSEIIAPQSDVFTKAQEAISNIQSYRISFSSIQESEGATKQLSAEGEFGSSEQSYLKLMLGGQTNEYITIGNKKYIQDEEKLTGWNVAFNTAFVPDKEAALDTLKQLMDIQTLPDETIEGVNCFHYRGKYPENPGVENMIAEMNSKLTEEQIEQAQVEFDQMRTSGEVDIWISRDDYFIRQEQVTIRNSEGQAVTTSVSKFSNFNQPVIIEPPLDDNGQLLPGWRAE